MVVMVQNTARGPAQISGTEKVLKHTYDDLTEKWEVSTIYVRLDPTVISEGTNRFVYNITDLSAPKGKQNKVAKAAKSRNESRQETFKAVVMQKRCQRLAEKFNSLGAPKKVNFIDCCIVEFVQRPTDHTGGRPIMIMEPRLEGTYKKYSNNFGYVDKEDRNTPQAFSHFTFQYTSGKMIVVDIQGVKDNYTDPQIHSNIPESAPPIWGQGDMGDTGVYKFFESHRCNALCKFYGLNHQPFASSQQGTRSSTAGATTKAAPPPIPSPAGARLSSASGYPGLPYLTYSGTTTPVNDILETRVSLRPGYNSFQSTMNYTWKPDVVVH